MASESTIRPVRKRTFVQRVKEFFGWSKKSGSGDSQSSALLRNDFFSLREQGKHDQAIAAAQKLLAKHPDDASMAKSLGDLLAPRDKKRAAANYLGAAVHNAQHGFYRQALALARLALSLDASRTDARQLLGDVLLSLGEINEAFAEFETAIEAYAAAGDAARAEKLKAHLEQARTFYAHAQIKSS